MPNRILRDGILSSERVSRLSFAAEVFYRRIMSLVDDYGRYTADPVILRSMCYPRRVDQITLDQIEAWMAEATSREGLRPCERPLIRLYEVNGKQYLEVQDFGQTIRANKSKYPTPPDSTEKQPYAPANPRKREIAKTETETETDAKAEPVAVDDIAERMYARHPRKKNKPLVEMELVSFARKHGAAKLEDVDAVHGQWCASEEWQREGGRYVPALDRWISDEGYTQSPPRSGAAVRTMPVMRTPWAEAQA